MKIIVTIFFLFCGTTILFAQKVRLEGDNSPYLCLNDSIAEIFELKLNQNKIDSSITILYDFDNGRLQTSRRIIIWTDNGLSRIRLVQGCNKITIDTIYTFNSADLWQYISDTHFDDVTKPIKAGEYQSHDKFYHITVTIPKKSFFIVVRDYERKSKAAQCDTRVILTNKIDALFK